MNDFFTLNEHAHSLTPNCQYYIELRSHHPRESNNWSSLHKAIKETARNIIFDLQRPADKHTGWKETPPISKIALRELKSELKMAFPYRHFDVSELESNYTEWFNYVIHLQGTTVAQCEFFIRPITYTGKHHVQRNDSPRNSSSLST